MSVNEAQDRIDSSEFTEWIAYYRIEPFGPQRADIQAGIISATVANASPNRQKGKGFVPADFMLFTEQRPQRMSQKEIDTRMQAFIDYTNQCFKGK